MKISRRFSQWNVFLYAALHYCLLDLGREQTDGSSLGSSFWSLFPLMQNSSRAMSRVPLSLWLLLTLCYSCGTCSKMTALKAAEMMFESVQRGTSRCLKIRAYYSWVGSLNSRASRAMPYFIFSPFGFSSVYEHSRSRCYTRRHSLWRWMRHSPFPHKPHTWSEGEQNDRCLVWCTDKYRVIWVHSAETDYQVSGGREEVLTGSDNIQEEFKEDTGAPRANEKGKAFQEERTAWANARTHRAA